jgi:hypothetical protein
MGAVWLIILSVYVGYFVMIFVVGLLKHLDLLQYVLVWGSNAILIYIVCTVVTYIIMGVIIWRRRRKKKPT